MSPVRLIILLVAAGAAIGAVFLVRSIQAPAPAQAASVEVREVSTKEILVARREIPIGRFVTVEDLAWQPWPEESDTSFFVDKENYPEGIEDQVGAVAVARMVVGEPVVAEKLVKPGEQGFMAAMLTPGMRAVSVRTNADSSASGFIKPQDRVDVTVVRSAVGAAPTIGDDVGEVLLSNVRVLAINSVYSPPIEGEGATLIGERVTLELSERDATLVLAAEEAGALKLTLRSIADLQDRSGATALGRTYRDGLDQSIRIYRYGDPEVATVPAG